jgi:hypothetical protein
MGAMTSSTTDQPAAPKRTILGLSLPQVLGGTLAAMTTALLASRLGVSGTVAGAAFGSLVSAIAGALYTHSIDRAHDRVLVTRERLVAMSRSDGKVVRVKQVQVDTVPADEVPAEAVPTDTVPADAAHGPEPDEPRREPSRIPGWRTWLVAAVALFAVVMLAITVIEGLIGRPVSGGTETGGGTTVTEVLGDDSPASPSPSVLESPDGATSAPDASPSSGEVSPSDTFTDTSTTDTSTETTTDTAPSPTSEPAPPSDGASPFGG